MHIKWKLVIVVVCVGVGVVVVVDIVLHLATSNDVNRTDEKENQFTIDKIHPIDSHPTKK